MKEFLGACLAAGLALAATPLVACQLDAPSQVEVYPLILVPPGEPGPSPALVRGLTDHLTYAQQRYGEILDGDTFRLARTTPEVRAAAYPLSYYLRMGAAKGMGIFDDLAAEILEHDGFNRFNCPYVYLVVFQDSSQEQNIPVNPMGDSLNGCMNTGGGFAFLGSRLYDFADYFQVFVLHELGHAFGLQHPDAYGYSQEDTRTIMGTMDRSQWKGAFRPASPETLLPENLRAISLNRRVFPRFRFDPARHVPAGYSLQGQIKCNGPKVIKGQLPYAMAEVSTTSGETYGSKVSHAVLGEIKPGGAGSSYDGASMWHSGAAKDGWVSLEWTFPLPATMTSIRIHSEHSGKYHRAEAMRLEAFVGSIFTRAATADLGGIDATVSFPPRSARRWRLHLRASATGHVVLRGLQFFHGTRELMPPAVPLPGS